MDTQTANHCRHCSSTNTIRHGYTAKGKQRYRCHDCGRCFVEEPASPAYDPARKEEILRAYHQRASLRGLTAASSASRATPLKEWLKKSG